MVTTALGAGSVEKGALTWLRLPPTSTMRHSVPVSRPVETCASHESQVSFSSPGSTVWPTHLHLERVLGHADRLEARAEDVVCGRVSNLVGKGKRGTIGKGRQDRMDGRKDEGTHHPSGDNSVP
jgi:hypothetical protein